MIIDFCTLAKRRYLALERREKMLLRPTNKICRIVLRKSAEEAKADHLLLLLLL